MEILESEHSCFEKESEGAEMIFNDISLDEGEAIARELGFRSKLAILQPGYYTQTIIETTLDNK